MSWRDRLLSPAGALALTVFLMAVAWIECSRVPWAPFYIVYVALTIGIPLRLGADRIGLRRTVRKRTLWLAAGIGIVAQFALSLLLLQLGPRLLAAAGVAPDALATPFWNLNAAQALLFERLGPRWHTAAVPLQMAYIGFLVLWAGFGEEIYFRGYLHAALERQLRLAPMIAISSVLFGLRHAMQLAFLGPDYPFGAAATWVLVGVLLGIVLGLLYARTRSLWPPIVAHYTFNLVPVALLLAAG